MNPNWIPALWRAARTMLAAFWKLTRQLFHEATGTLFALFAIYSGSAAWKQSRQPGGMWIASLALAYALMMAFFAFSAFRTARRIR